MAINLASKYSDKIAEAFSRGSFVKGKTADTYDLTGVKTLKVYTPITVAETDYLREGMTRYGTPTEMQDTVQELTMTQDKAFTLTIDKGNNQDQNLVKRAADMLRLQLAEKSTPAADKYALRRFFEGAGRIAVLGGSDEITKANIISKIADGVQALDDALVPEENRYLYIPSNYYKLICTSEEFVSIPALGEKSIGKGTVGELLGLSIVRVPRHYMPIGSHFLIAHRDSLLMPYKIADAKIHNDPVGVSGALIEGRHYYDAFVLGAKAYGVYALVDSSEKVAVPVITIANGLTTLKSNTAGARVRYTLDDSDPRYSASAIEYTAPFTWPDGNVLRYYAHKDEMYPSDVMVRRENERS